MRKAKDFIRKYTLQILYNAQLMPQFNYCATVCHKKKSLGSVTSQIRKELDRKLQELRKIEKN